MSYSVMSLILFIEHTNVTPHKKKNNDDEYFAPSFVVLRV